MAPPNHRIKSVQRPLLPLSARRPSPRHLSPFSMQTISPLGRSQVLHAGGRFHAARDPQSGTNPSLRCSLRHLGYELSRPRTPSAEHIGIPHIPSSPLELPGGGCVIIICIEGKENALRTALSEYQIKKGSYGSSLMPLGLA